MKAALTRIRVLLTVKEQAQLLSVLTLCHESNSFTIID